MRRKPARSPLHRRQKLSLQCLEERTVPAFNLTIDGDGFTQNVTSTLVDGVRTFQPNASAAILDLDDIETALNAGEDVVVSSGGPDVFNFEVGSINWSFDSVQDDLDYFVAPIRNLTFQTDATSEDSANIFLNNVFLNSSDNLNLTFDVAAQGTDSDVIFANDTRINNARNVTLTAGAGSGQITYDSAPLSPMTVSGDIDISAFAFQPSNADSILTSTSGNIAVNAKLDLTLASATTIRAENGTLTLAGTVDSGNDLSLYGNTVDLQAAVGGVTPLNSLTFAGGTSSFLGTINAATVNIGDNVFDTLEATLSNAGVITGDVIVNAEGILSPAGSGTIGAINITGDLTFDFGEYDLDLLATRDIINVTGDLIINGGLLTNSAGTALLPGAGDFPIIDFTGTLTGAFDNAPLNTGLLFGLDAIQVTNYGPAATDVTIAKVAATPGGILTASEADGTAYTLKLTGGGELTAFTNAFGQLSVLAVNTTLKSKITMTTKANASDALVALGPIVIRGDLGAFNAPGANAFAGLNASATPGTTGALKSLSFFQFLGDLNTPGVISAFTTKFNAVPAITASAIGKIKVGQILAGFGNWNIANGIGSITAGQINGLNVTATSIGTIAVKGDKKLGLSGDILFSNFTLTGNDNTPKSYGLKTLTAAGSVFNSTFDVQEGNVNSVTVGRFVNSNLYLDYTPGAAFDTGGTFGLPAAAFTLSKFTTTAKTIGDTSNPFNFAFSGSQVVADTIGTVRLSGLNTDNGGVAMGFKSRTAGGSIRTKTASGVVGAIALNTNLTPGAAALAGDFFYLDVV